MYGGQTGMSDQREGNDDEGDGNDIDDGGGGDDEGLTKSYPSSNACLSKLVSSAMVVIIWCVAWVAPQRNQQPRKIRR